MIQTLQTPQPTKPVGRPRKQVTPDRIANTLIEDMFFRSADDRDVLTYYSLLEVPVRGPGLATSYASKKVSKTFYELLDSYGQ